MEHLYRSLRRALEETGAFPDEAELKKALDLVLTAVRDETYRFTADLDSRAGLLAKRLLGLGPFTEEPPSEEWVELIRTRAESSTLHEVALWLRGHVTRALNAALDAEEGGLCLRCHNYTEKLFDGFCQRCARHLEEMNAQRDGGKSDPTRQL